jgi:hypothetical protein
MTQRSSDCKVTDLKMILDDGRELPAQVVLRDRDLDLAFIRPVEKPAQPLPAIDTSKIAKLQVVDDIVILLRMGKVASRVPAVFIDSILAVVEKPRTFYVPGYVSMQAGTGAAVFSLDGRFAGMVVLRALQGQDLDNFGAYYVMTDEKIIPIVLPAEDIVEVSKQAPKVKSKK